MSALGDRAEDYLALRRALGFKLDRQGQLLFQFVDYVESQGAEQLTTALAVAWARIPDGTNPAWWNRRLSGVWGFARHLQAVNHICEVPPADILPAHYRRTTPFLFFEEEILALMAAAKKLAPALRAATYETLVGLLAVTGMRVGEAIRLRRGDLDWTDGVIVVHNSKFGKSREIPLQPSTIEALRGYARQRDRLRPAPAPDSFFVSSTGRGLNRRMVDWTFQRLVAAAGIDYSGRHRAPRPHDLRHSFVVATLRAWYTDGAAVEALMPRLSTYVGHTKPADTYWYLQAAPELLALAVERLEQAAAARS